MSLWSETILNIINIYYCPHTDYMQTFSTQHGQTGWVKTTWCFSCTTFLNCPTDFIISVTVCNNSVTVVCKELSNYNALLFKDEKTKTFFLVETGFFNQNNYSLFSDAESKRNEHCFLKKYYSIISLIFHKISA